MKNARIAMPILFSLIVLSSCSSRVLVNDDGQNLWAADLSIEFEEFFRWYMTDLYGSEDELAANDLVDSQLVGESLTLGSPQSSVLVIPEGRSATVVNGSSLDPEAVLANLVDAGRGAITRGSGGEYSVLLNRDTAALLLRFYAGDELADTLLSYVSGARTRSELLDNLVWAFEGYEDASVLERLFTEQSLFIRFPAGSSLETNSSAIVIDGDELSARVFLLDLLLEQDMVLRITFP